MIKIETVSDISRLHRAIESISFETFCRIGMGVLQTDTEYMGSCWPSFLRDPLGYIASRRPESQGDALLELIERIYNEDKR